ncbi:MAG: cytochrome c [Planctomycetes bacterium]|nr:cytochrome c [Planctomycetota bacterium]
MYGRRCAVTVALLAAVGIGFVFAGGSLLAQKAKGKTRAAATKYLMRGINQPNCKGLGDLLKDSGPADDKAWDTAACHASVLNEMGHLLMDDGRCPDGDWAGAAKSLREGSAAVLAAVEKKDLTAANTAFKTVTGACASCHKAHRSK